MYQAHIFIAGQVQGVGFRQFVRWISRKVGVTGWVRNLDDGRVEAILQGEKSQIEQVITVCKKGPTLAEVKDVQAEWEEASERFGEFTVLKSNANG